MNRILIAFFWLMIFCLNYPAQETAPNSVSLNLIATDKSNVLIDDLKKEELQLLIDGKPQPITSLEKQELPLVYALAVDCSGSMRLIFEKIINSAKEIVNQNRAADEAFLIRFVGSDNITGSKSFSADKNALNRELSEFYVEGGATALIDAVYMAVQQAAGHKADDGKSYRRAVIVITDGEDRASYYTDAKLIELIKKENVAVFFIALTDNLEYGGGPTMIQKNKIKDLMKRIAETSGGAVFTPKNKALKEAGAAILPVIRTQYVLSSAPIVGDKNNAPKLEVKLIKDSPRKDVKFFLRQNN